MKRPSWIMLMIARIAATALCTAIVTPMIYYAHKEFGILGLIISIVFVFEYMEFGRLINKCYPKDKK